MPVLLYLTRESNSKFVRQFRLFDQRGSLNKYIMFIMITFQPGRSPSARAGGRRPGQPGQPAAAAVGRHRRRRRHAAAALRTSTAQLHRGRLGNILIPTYLLALTHSLTHVQIIIFLHSICDSLRI